MNNAKAWVLLPALLLFLCSIGQAGSYGEYEQRVNKGMGLPGVFPGMTVTSTPLLITVKNKNIPEGAVVESVTVATGSITNDKRANAVNVISTYNIQAPGMREYVSTRWAGKGRDTTFTEAELGADDIPVKGTWRITMTGNNAGVSRATTSHTVKSIKFKYRYE